MTAEAIAQKLLGARFKSPAFREVCAHLSDDFDAEGLAKALAPSLDDAGRQTLIKCLKAVAEADGEIAAREQMLIASMEKIFDVSAA